jgi:N,N'-diacetyllegionaminate synthase
LSSDSFDIGGHKVGAGHSPFIVAEVAQAHDGSLGAAHAYVDAVAKTGAQAIKFQLHIAAAESTRSETFRVKFSPQDQNRYDYWKRMEFSEEQWVGLSRHASERGLLFLCSPFSIAAVELLERLGVPAWKIGAGEITTAPLLDRVARTGRPVILSSGVAGWSDLDAAVARVRQGRAPVAVLQATTSYPCPPEALGLNVIPELRQRYRCPVGLSDHSAKTYAGLAAVALGADLLEVHVVFSRECFGPDTIASLTTAELSDLVTGARFIHASLSSPVDKDAMAAKLADVRALFGKSLVAARDLPAGHRIAADDVAFKKPGHGIPAGAMDRVQGRRLRRAMASDELFSEDNLE